MTYNVFGRTLNPTLLPCFSVADGNRISLSVLQLKLVSYYLCIVAYSYFLFNAAVA